jgi:hypothetical protein
MTHYSDKGLSKEQTMVAFDEEISRQEDIVYGTALFFECLSVVHANQPAVVETYRKQFRNVIQKGRERIGEAIQLRKTVRESPAQFGALPEFVFESCQGHAQPEEMTKRAVALVATYREIFQGRPRSREFTTDETLRLIESASELLK